MPTSFAKTACGVIVRSKQIPTAIARKCLVPIKLVISYYCIALVTFFKNEGGILLVLKLWDENIGDSCLVIALFLSSRYNELVEEAKLSLLSGYTCCDGGSNT